jgi:hypothetical protein
VLSSSKSLSASELLQDTRTAHHGSLDATMASTSTQPFCAEANMTLIPVKTLDDDSALIVKLTSIAHFPDSQRMMSESWDKTAQQWDLPSGKETKEA